MVLTGLIVGCLAGPAWHAPENCRCDLGPLSRGTIILLVLFLLWLTATRTGRQTWSVAEVGILTIPQRRGVPWLSS